MNVDQAMTPHVVVLAVSDTLQKAQLDMALSEIRHLVVCDNLSRVVGVLSNRDLLRACGREGFDASASVAEVMTRDVSLVLPKVPLHAAVRMMLDGAISALPVVSGENELLGIVTTTDVLRVVHRLLRHPQTHLEACHVQEAATVEQMMSREVISVLASDSVERAQAKMTENSIRHLPIVNSQEQLVGIVSSRDLERAMSPQGGGSWLAVATLSKAMTHVVEPLTPAFVAVDMMLQHKIGALPVVSNGKLVGIVSEKDVLRLAVGLLRPSNLVS